MNLPDPVDHARQISTSVLPQHRQTTVLLVRGAGNVDLTQASDRLAMQESIPINPQQFTQAGRVTAIGLRHSIRC